MAQAMYKGENLTKAGATAASTPLLGQELFVFTRDHLGLNVGQVKAVEYEDGCGRGFNVKSTRIEGSAYVRLANPDLAIELRTS